MRRPRFSLPVPVLALAALIAPAALGACTAPAAGPGAAQPQPSPSRSTALPLGPAASGGGSGTAAGLSLAPRHTSPFSLVGVVWDDAAQPLDAVVRFRAHRVHGTWGPWTTLDSSDADTPTPAANGGRAALGGTPPLWVGPSDGVQVALRPAGRGPMPAALPPLPAGLRLELVDAGDAAATGTGSGGTTAAAGTRWSAPEPAIVPRSVWGPGTPGPDTPIQYADEVRAVFIHHTDSGNDYDCKDAPDVIRSIEEYHVRDRAYDDIGYNFLVDRCGTIYEGRPGGISRPVIGAHTLGFNIGTAGIAAIGSFPTGTPVPKPMIDAIARLVAWKLGLAGIDPRGKVTLTSSDSGARFPKGTSHVFDTVSGHRDGGWTFCPGGALYAALPEIRAEAARLQHRPGA